MDQRVSYTGVSNDTYSTAPMGNVNVGSVTTMTRLTIPAQKPSLDEILYSGREGIPLKRSAMYPISCDNVKENSSTPKNSAHQRIVT